MDFAPWRRLPPHLPVRALGGRVADRPGTDPPRREGDREPPRQHRRTRPIPGSPSTKGAPTNSRAACGSARSAGAATGSWPSSRPRTSRCALRAGSTLSISAIPGSRAKRSRRRPFTGATRGRLRRSIAPDAPLRARRNFSWRRLVTVRPVLYNSWEATEFAVDEPGQTALAEMAAEIGVERS